MVPENGKKGQRNQIVNVYCLGARALKTADGRKSGEEDDGTARRGDSDLGGHGEGEGEGEKEEAAMVTVIEEVI